MVSLKGNMIWLLEGVRSYFLTIKIGFYELKRGFEKGNERLDFGFFGKIKGERGKMK